MTYIDLTWTEKCSARVSKDIIFDTFVDFYQTSWDDSTYIENIIMWLDEHLENNIQEFLQLLDIEPSDWSDDVKYDFISTLLSKDMMSEFREYYKANYE